MYKHVLQGSFWFGLLLHILACTPPPVASPQHTAIEINSTLPSDPAIDSLIAPYKEQLEAKMNEVIGYAARELTEDTVESRLGNFVADLLLEAGKQQWGDSVELSLITNGGLRVPLPKGPITLGTIYELMPFENRLVLVKITGKQLKLLFDYGARNSNISVSNSQYSIRAGNAENIFIDKKPLDENKIYYLSTYDYLAWGGDHMEFMRETQIVIHADILFRDAILAKFKQLNISGMQADAEIEGRVIILN